MHCWVIAYFGNNVYLWSGSLIGNMGFYSSLSLSLKNVLFLFQPPYCWQFVFKLHAIVISGKFAI